MPIEAVSGVVLAAGPSKRFGSDPPKQLLPIGGEPLVRRVARRALAARVAEVIVVLGFEADRVRAALGDLSVRVVVNRRFAAGQSGSVKLGLAALDPAAVAAVFIPVDQPALSTALIDALITTYLRTRGSIVVPVHGGTRGSPVLFDRRLFEELAAIEGDRGGRQLFPRHEAEIVELPLASPEPLRDIDTLEDLQRIGLGLGAIGSDP